MHFISDRSAFARSVRDARNRLVHQGSDPNHNKFELYELADSLKWLIRCCFLRDLGLDRVEVDGAIGRWFQNNQWRLPRKQSSGSTGPV